MKRAVERTNVVVVVLEQCSASALSCYGNNHAVTPNIDRLASQGVLFTNAFTTFPKCVPARCAMMTGRYPHVEGHRTLPGFQIRSGENNLPAELKQNGYTCVLAGKNNTVEKDAFDECFSYRLRSEWGTKVRKQSLQEGDDPNLFRAQYRQEEYKATGLGDSFSTAAACQFVHEHAKKRDEPFFLLLNLLMPHPPYIPISPFIEPIGCEGLRIPLRENIEDAPRVLATYRRIYDLEMLSRDEWRKILGAHCSMVSFADDCVGKVVRAIDEAGLAGNTLVICTSDHGGFAGAHGTVDKWDTMFYDCLTKVPLVMRFPPMMNQGLRIDALTDNVDIAPSILDWCGFEPPKWIQGKSLTGVISGRETGHKQAVFCEGGVEDSALERIRPVGDELSARQRILRLHPWTLSRAKMIRTKQWKLVFRTDGYKELYNLQDDPLELMNVAGLAANTSVTSDLMERMLTWTIGTETDYPPIEELKA